MSVDVFLIRHGETPWNTKEVFRGRIDIPLSEEGLMQAEKTGDALVSCTLGAVYTSPQKRSFETARIIGEKQNIPPIPLTGFMDVSFGEWEGKQLKEVKETYPDLYQKWRENPEKVGFPEGESLDDVRERSCKELERLVAQHNGETVVIVTHRVVLKVLICWLLGLDN